VAEKDFMALNKAAVNRGIINAKDQFQFRHSGPQYVDFGIKYD
jgi:hypothetical protein